MRKRPGYVRMWAVGRGGNAGEASDDEGGPVRRQRVAQSCYTVLCRLYYLGNARSGGTNEDAGRVAAGAMMHSTTDVKSRGLWEFVGWRLYAGCRRPKWFDIALLSPCHEPSARKLRTNVGWGSSKDESQRMEPRTPDDSESGQPDSIVSDRRAQWRDLVLRRGKCRDFLF